MAEEDRKAFLTCLYREYFELLYTIVKNRFPHQADDIICDLFCYRLLPLPLNTFEETFKYLDQFMIRCTINFCNTTYLRKSKKQLLKNTFCRNHMDKRSDFVLKTTEIMLDLKRTLDKLPARQEKVFLLHCYFGYKHIEIVQLCKDVTSESISKQVLYRAKKNLQRYFFE